ncbi:MAG: HD family phosphohydrolase [Pyramidobacter sp.]|jgi:putative nucleotidyltransferase with HDIG domain
MKNIQPERSEWGAIMQEAWGWSARALPYLAAAMLAVLVVSFRWLSVDADTYFIVGTPASRNYYAVRDMSYDDNETAEKLRNEVANGIAGVLVKGHMKSEVGFDDECELLLNKPLEDTLLPQELRELINDMPLDRREQIIATVRSIHDDLQQDLSLTGDERVSFIWQRISLMESDPSSANVIFQVITALTEGDQKIDSNLTNRVKSMVASDIEVTKHLFYVGDVIVSKGEVITPQMASILKLQGYPEGSFPWASALFSMLVASVAVFWIRKSTSRDLAENPYLGSRYYPYFLLILGWFLQLGVISWHVVGLGLFPVIAVIYLTLPDFSALNCVSAMVLSASLITAGYDVATFAINVISGFTGVILGPILFRRNYSRSAVWLHVFILGVIMMSVALLVEGELKGSLPLAHLGVTGASCLVLSFMVIVLLPLMEILFDIVSPLQLVELAQPSHPLLKRMQVEAPGTYHHCQMVGNLAEAAAEKIGLNPILMCVGAYFHDIGKLKRPQFFIENQISGINSHDKLSPAMSAMVILSHVKDGLELADEYRLPSQIKAFIPEHHGTTCLTYFYKKAQQSGLKVQESQFSYPGPKPQSKETGLLMLADSTEAAARAASRHLKGVQDLSRLVNDVVQSKMNSGQLDNVPFTLQDITNIKSALITTLRSMYHTRNIKPLNSPPQKENGKDISDSHGKTTSDALQTQKTEKKEA